jgi:hypothetical protein
MRYVGEVERQAKSHPRVLRRACNGAAAAGS